MHDRAPTLAVVPDSPPQEAAPADKLDLEGSAVYQAQVARLHEKLARIAGELEPLKQRGAVTNRNGGVRYPYALDIDKGNPIRLKLAEYHIHMASDVEPGTTTITFAEVSGWDGKSITVCRVTLYERTTFTDGDTGATFTCRHLGGAEDGDVSNACKQAQTSARSSMLTGVFNLVNDDSAKVYVPNGTQNQPPSGQARGKRKAATADQVRKIEGLAKSRGVALGSDQMRELLRAASNGFAKAISTEGMSYGDAEELAKALDAMPLLGSDQVAPLAYTWPPNVNEAQSKALNTALASGLVSEQDVDAAILTVSDRHTQDISDLTSADIDRVINTLRAKARRVSR